MATKRRAQPKLSKAAQASYDWETKMPTYAGYPSEEGENQKAVKRLNRDRDWSGIRGYPSDKEYMAKVGKAKLEEQQDVMRTKGRRVEADYRDRKAYPPKKKVARKRVTVR